MRDKRIRLGLVVLLLVLGANVDRLGAASASAFEAATCLYAGLSYSEGACRGGQRCGSDGAWFDDSTCKSAVEELAN